MINLTHSNQIALAVISASTGHTNSKQIAKECLANAREEEFYALATDSEPAKMKMSVNKQGVYSFRTC